MPNGNGLIVDSKLIEGKTDRILRRYISLPKLIDLFRTSELYLCKASELEDNLEGTLPEAIRQSFRECPDFIADEGDPVACEKSLKEKTYLNCWTLGAKDNIALWKLYGGGLSEAVAVTTTVSRLVKASSSWTGYDCLEIKKVLYIEHDKKIPDGIYGLDSSLFGFKHRAYFFEKEVRIIMGKRSLDGHGESPMSVKLPVDLNSFVRSIVVAPEADKWFVDLVKDLVEKYGINPSVVRRSKLTRLINSAK
jgi:hypothetical protein